MRKDSDIFVELAAIGVAFAVKVSEAARRKADIERALIAASAAVGTDAGARIPGPVPLQKIVLHLGTDWRKIWIRIPPSLRNWLPSGQPKHWLLQNHDN